MNWWTPKIARFVDFVAAVVAVCILGRLAWQEDLNWIGAVVVCLLVISLATVRWPYGILTLLIGASAMPVFSVEVGGWNARPEHFAVVLAVFAVGLWLIKAKKRVNLTRIDYCILFFVGANFIGSSLGSSDPASTLRWALQNCLAICFYFLIRILLQNAEVLRRAVNIFLTIGVAESVYGIICYMSHQAFDTSFGVQIGQYLNDVAAPFGTMFEANLFGAFAASTSVVSLCFYLFGGHRVRYFIFALIAAIATLISFSRASLVALFLIGLYLLWKNRRNAAAIDPRKLMAALAGVVLILVLFSGPLGRIVRERFTNLLNEGLAEETTISRAIIIQEALQEVPGHLLIGRGTASFNLTFDWNKYIPSWASEKTWIGNAPLRILHDTGLLGLGSMVAFFVTVWLRIRPALKAPSQENCLVVAMWAGVLIYSISFQSTDGTILAFTWVQLGLLASAATLSPI